MIIKGFAVCFSADKSNNIFLNVSIRTNIDEFND